VRERGWNQALDATALSGHGGRGIVDWGVRLGRAFESQEGVHQERWKPFVTLNVELIDNRDIPREERERALGRQAKLLMDDKTAQVFQVADMPPGWAGQLEFIQVRCVRSPRKWSKA